MEWPINMSIGSLWHKSCDFVTVGGFETDVRRTLEELVDDELAFWMVGEVVRSKVVDWETEPFIADPSWLKRVGKVAELAELADHPITLWSRR